MTDTAIKQMTLSEAAQALREAKASLSEREADCARLLKESQLASNARQTAECELRLYLNLVYDTALRAAAE